MCTLEAIKKVKDREKANVYGAFLLLGSRVGTEGFKGSLFVVVVF